MPSIVLVNERDNAERQKPDLDLFCPNARLMVCLGNICRTPAAEAVLDHLVRKRKLEGSVFVDSCGTVCISYFLLSGLMRCSCLLTDEEIETGKKLILSDHSPSQKQK